MPSGQQEDQSSKAKEAAGDSESARSAEPLVGQRGSAASGQEAEVAPTPSLHESTLGILSSQRGSFRSRRAHCPPPTPQSHKPKAP